MAYAFQDSTAGLSCGTAYGKALIAYTPDNGFTGGDTMEIKYCVANNPVCVTYKLYFNVLANTNPACPCIDDCVWSGDLNGDGKVTAHDLLTLGRFLGYQGPARDTATTAWGANEAVDWGVQLPNGKDLKHADANGDGHLTAEDMQGILDNFNKVNSLVPTENLGYKEFPFVSFFQLQRSRTWRYFDHLLYPGHRGIPCQRHPRTFVFTQHRWRLCGQLQPQG